MSYTIINDNNIDYLKTLKDNSVDSIITDPPYGIEFLGKDWDKNTGAVETWQECLRVLKPGGHLLAFSAARTYHHLATNIESVGFEVRDQLMWLYASGFPKAQDIGKAIDRREGKRKNNSLGIKRSRIESGPKTNCPKCNKTLNGSNQYKCQDNDCPLQKELKSADNEWAGWKTSMKPAHEPIVMARKPFKGSTIDNVLEHGVGALNIDANRIPYENEKDLDTYLNNIAGPMERSTASHGDTIGMHEGKTGFKVQKGKVKRPSAGNRTSSFHNATGGGETQSGGDGSGDWTHNEQGRFPSNVIGEVEHYQQFFYCPKVQKAERHMGTVNNNHPTVKPVALMKYLIKLVTPQNGKILDPFTGSGSTGMAAVELGYDFTGCELDPAYVDIANTRISAWKHKTDLSGNKLPEEFFTEEI